MKNLIDVIDLSGVPNILALLNDDKEYYGGVGKKFLSNSDIGTLLTNPKDFGKSREDSKAFMDGRYFHQLILEPEKAVNTPFVDVSTRTTKEYKNYCETNNLPFCMLKKEMEEVENLVNIIKGNILVNFKIINWSFCLSWNIRSYIRITHSNISQCLIYLLVCCRSFFF